MWNRLAWLIAPALLSGCTVARVGDEPEAASITDPIWECVTIDPMENTPQDTPCFRALLSAKNEITLQWRVTNTLPQVYIYNDFGLFRDIGFQPVVCQSQPEDSCATTLKVKEGGFRRWVLRADHPDGAATHVAASISVPAPFAPTISGAGFVDMLSPTERTISWVADQRNAPCDENEKTAWIERSGSIFHDGGARFPRCGQDAKIIIPAAELSDPGSHNYRVRDCHLPDGSDTKFCSPFALVKFQTGSDRFLVPNPIYTESGRDLKLAFTTRSGDIRRLSSTTLIPRDNQHTDIATTDPDYTVDAQRLTPGVHSIKLTSCKTDTGACSPGDELQIIVNASIDWEWGRDYREDFEAGVGFKVLGPGEPLEITYDASGGIWLINEFSNAIEYVSPTGEAFSFTVPLGRQPQPDSSSYKSVAPFAFMYGPATLLPTSISTLGERATRVESKVWFTQGGGMLGTTNIQNHSRVISFDPSLSDSPSTFFDDRLCVYNVPTDDPDRLGNNQVIGLTATKQRIWIGESRGLFDDVPSAISSFIPNPGSCDNLLNFDDPEALANQSLQYCGPGQTPEQDACMEKFLLDKLPPGIKVAHLVADPHDDSVWFTDAHGRYLGNLDPNSSVIFKLYPLPDSDSDTKSNLFRGFPWSIAVENDAVYVAEFFSRALLRFDKAAATFDKIDVPGVSSRGTIPSIDIDPATNRLWFTLPSGQDTIGNMASTIGYIDLTSWREHLADPQGAQISGVIYRGVDTIAAPETSLNGSIAFAGIAIDPASGKIALATVGRKQITELKPKAGSWP